MRRSRSTRITLDEEAELQDNSSHQPASARTVRSRQEFPDVRTPLTAQPTSSSVGAFSHFTPSHSRVASSNISWPPGGDSTPLDQHSPKVPITAVGGKGGGLPFGASPDPRISREFRRWRVIRALVWLLLVAFITVAVFLLVHSTAADALRLKVFGVGRGGTEEKRQSNGPAIVPTPHSSRPPPAPTPPSSGLLDGVSYTTASPIFVAILRDSSGRFLRQRLFDLARMQSDAAREEGTAAGERRMIPVPLFDSLPPEEQFSVELVKVTEFQFQGGKPVEFHSFELRDNEGAALSGSKGGVNGIVPGTKHPHECSRFLEGQKQVRDLAGDELPQHHGGPSGRNKFGRPTPRRRRHPGRAVEWIGDSVTCGVCNMCHHDPHFSAALENFNVSFSQIVCRGLGANCRVECGGGRGLVMNEQVPDETTMAGLFQRSLATEAASSWDFFAKEQRRKERDNSDTGKETHDGDGRSPFARGDANLWNTPQVVVVNLGSNDFFTAPKQQSRELRMMYVTRYVDFVKTVAKWYGATTTFLLACGPVVDFYCPLVVEVMMKLRADGTVTLGGHQPVVHVVDLRGLMPPELSCCGHPDLTSHAIIASVIENKIRLVMGWRDNTAGFLVRRLLSGVQAVAHAFSDTASESRKAAAEAFIAFNNDSAMPLLPYELARRIPDADAVAGYFNSSEFDRVVGDMLRDSQEVAKVVGGVVREILAEEKSAVVVPSPVYDWVERRKS